MRVDHLVWCVPELDAGIAKLESMTGVKAIPGGSHPGVGTHNALASLGSRKYLEIIAPDPGQTEFRRPRVFRIDEIREPTLVTWAAATSQPGDLAARKFADGQRLGDLRSLSRVRPDGVELSWTMTDPYTEIDGGIVPFLIDWGETPHPGDNAPPGISLLSLCAWHPDPDTVMEKLARLDIDMKVAPGKLPRLVAMLDTPAGRVELG